jgi:hypothetical protein
VCCLRTHHGEAGEAKAVEEAHRENLDHCLNPVANAGRVSDEIKVVGEEFGLVEGRGVVAPKVIVLEFGKGERVLFGDPVLNARGS